MVFAITRVAAADGGRDQEQGENSQKLERDGAMDGGKNHWPKKRTLTKEPREVGAARIVNRRDTRTQWYPASC